MDDLSPLLNQVLGFYCHRMPERMLHCGEASSILCARCTGIYTGVFVGAVIIWLRGRMWSPGRISLAIGVGLLLLCFADSRDTSVVWTPPAATRLFTGFGAGLVLGAWGAVLARGNNVGPRQAARARWYVITSVVVATIIVVLSKCGWVMLLSAASGVGLFATHVLAGVIVVRRAATLFSRPALS